MKRKLSLLLALLLCAACVFCACSDNSAQNKGRKINSVNHRGYQDAPENTLSAFRLSAEMGWVGFMASYNGRFFDGGYSGNGVKGKDGVRNYIDESISDILIQIEKLRGVDFRCCSYDTLDIPSCSIIYCDPPYRDTKQYDKIDFEYEYFYYWCEKMSKLGNKVFISEYWMPPFFKEVWSMEVRCNINIEKNTRVEKLFTI